MRLTPPAMALAALLATVSSVSHGQRPDNQIDPRSAAIVKLAEAEVAGGRLEAASGLLETALAVDPRNRTAYARLADVARKQGLPGKAIRLYREALLIEPNDVALLARQGEAMVDKGAVTKARENLARVKTLCATTCPEQATLAAAIERGSPADAMAARAPNPVPGEGKVN